MKNRAMKIYALLALFVALAPAQAQAQSSNVQASNIPFAFTVGQKHFPAGEYIIKRVNPASDKAVLLIQSAEGRASVMVQTLPVKSGKTVETAKLIFNRYEEQYFLSQVWMAADRTGLGVRASRQERALAREMKNKTPERETVALISRRQM